MRDIDKAIRLYQLMAQRCEDTMAPKQAEVYWDMADFMRQFETAAEASVGIKNSDYYLAPSVALMEDKLEALRVASVNNGFDQVADVYQKKLDEIAGDRDAIYETGYERTAQNLKIKYVQTMEGFGEMYKAYVRIKCAAPTDDVEIKDAMKDLVGAVGKLTLPSDSFTDLALQSNFRNLIPANDQGYREFVTYVRGLLDGAVNPMDQPEPSCGDAAAEWEQVKASKAQILQAGKTAGAKRQAARVTAVAPADASGDYTYIDEEVGRP